MAGLGTKLRRCRFYQGVTSASRQLILERNFMGEWGMICNTSGPCARRAIPLALLGLWVAGRAVAQTPVPQLPSGDDRTPYSEIQLVSSVAAVSPGVPFTLAVHLTVDPGWHTYWVNGGDAGEELLVEWSLPPGFSAGPLQWPVPKLLPAPPLMSYGYEGQVFFPVEITPPPDLASGSEVELRGAADFQVCADICLIALDDVSITLPVRSGSVAPDPSWGETVADVVARLPGPAEGWDVRAWTNGAEDETAAYVVEIAPNGSMPTPPPASLTAPHFFALGEFVIEHAAPQRIARIGDAIRIEVPRNYFAAEYETGLSGLIVADVGSESPLAWQIEAPVEELPPGVAAEPVDPLRATDVELTGGVPEGMAPLGRPQEATPSGADEGNRLGFAVALAFAFVGGVILNLMPCVFPVLSLKVMGLVGKGGSSSERARAHGLAFGVGILLSFWVLAGALVALRASGQSLGWGFQLQEPVFVGLLALLLFGLGLNLTGLFEIGVGMTRLGGLGGRDSLGDSALMGALTVVVATPCTAPFMGAAIGFAASQPPLVALAVFTSLGIGLAAPYVGLASSPALLSRLPSPGAWMETLKQALAFPMFGTVAWLAWVFGNQAGMDALALLLFALTLLSLAGWTYGRFGGRAPAWRGSWAALMVAVSAVALVVQGARIAEPSSPPTAAPTDAEWEPFSPERVAALQSEGRVVFVDFTADWCLSCQVNERIALRTDTVREAFAAHDVALLVADWTDRDSVIADAISSFGRSGIPLYLMYSPDPALEPEILPAVLTPGIVVEAIERAVEAG